MTGVGFFGKIPVRGDFVQSGLPRGFVLPWDAWLQRMLQASRVALGEAWLPAWLEAPVWRFALPAQACGPEPVLGLWMPSVDQAGRHFPLTFAAVGMRRPAGSADIVGWLEAVEQIGLAALEQDLTPEAIAVRLQAIAAPAPYKHPEAGERTRWWTEGGPGVIACTRQFTGMPGVADFASLLLDAPPSGDA